MVMLPPSASREPLLMMLAVVAEMLSCPLLVWSAAPSMVELLPMRSMRPLSAKKEEPEPSVRSEPSMAMIPVLGDVPLRAEMEAPEMETE